VGGEVDFDREIFSEVKSSCFLAFKIGVEFPEITIWQAKEDQELINEKLVPSIWDGTVAPSAHGRRAILYRNHIRINAGSKV
jgi:hypothetical protein